MIINKSLGYVVDAKKNLRCRNVYMNFSVYVLRRCVWRASAIVCLLLVPVVGTQKGQVATNAVESALESGRMGRSLRSAEIRHFFCFDLASSPIIPQTAAPERNIHEPKGVSRSPKTISQPFNSKCNCNTAAADSDVACNKQQVRVHFTFLPHPVLYFSFHRPQPKGGATLLMGDTMVLSKLPRQWQGKPKQHLQSSSAILVFPPPFFPTLDV